MLLPGLVQYCSQRHIRIINLFTSSLAKWVECSPMFRETWVQSQVASYQKLKKWYLIPPCLTLSNIRYVSRVKWSNPGKGVAPSPTPRCSSYWKGSLLVALDYGLLLYFYFLRALIWIKDSKIIFNRTSSDPVGKTQLKTMFEFFDSYQCS